MAGNDNDIKERQIDPVVKFMDGLDGIEISTLSERHNLPIFIIITDGHQKNNVPILSNIGQKIILHPARNHKH